MKSYSIGRDAGCDIVLNDNTDVISRRHAVLTVLSSGKMTITDLSTNGTYINGQRISSNVAVPVTRKDSVSFAHVSALDWNIIPKSNQWLTYLIAGLAAVAVIVAGIVFIPKLFDNPEKDDIVVPSPGSFAVTFMANADDAKGEMEAQVVRGGETVSLYENKYSREDYKFVGWNDQADGKGKAYEDKATISPTSNLKLYAQWEKTVVIITFKSNCGGNDNNMPPQKVKIATDTVLNPNAFINNGHVFVGWNTAPNPQKSESSTSFADKAVVNFTKDITLYAQWKAVDANYTITFDANGGKGTMASVIVEKGKSVTLPSNAFTREGYTFDGWKTGPNSGTSYGNKSSLKPKGNMKLYAQWKANGNERL